MIIGLLSCGKKKQTSSCKARDMYTSHLFKLGLEYLELVCDKVYILSSFYFLVPLDKIIEPYEATLKNLSKGQRKVWATTVAMQLQRLPFKIDEIHWCAGKEYQKPLKPFLEGIPQADRLGELPDSRFGYRMQWLKYEIERINNPDKWHLPRFTPVPRNRRPLCPKS